MSLYDLDFHAWANEQARLARERSGNRLDWENVAEELEDLGKQQVATLESRYVVLLTHLLKWAYQPSKRTRSWEGSIDVQRTRIRVHVRKNPSLKAVEHQTFLDAYEIARSQAAKETGLPKGTFPEAPPFSLAEAREESWMPADLSGSVA